MFTVKRDRFPIQWKEEEKKRQTVTLTKLCASWDVTMEGIHETTESTEHLVNYGTAQVSQAGLSVKAMVEHLWDYFECHCNVMHLLPLSSDWRLLVDRVQRGIPKARAHVVIPSSGWSLCVWSLLPPVHVSKQKKLWVIPSGLWTNLDGHFNWNMSDVFILTAWIWVGPFHLRLQSSYQSCCQLDVS